MEDGLEYRRSGILSFALKYEKDMLAVLADGSYREGRFETCALGLLSFRGR